MIHLMYEKHVRIILNYSLETISFLDLKLKLNDSFWLIGLYNTKLDFNFKVNCLTVFLVLVVKFKKMLYFRKFLELSVFVIIHYHLVLALKKLLKL